MGLQKIFETCQCRLLILVLELQPYLFCFIRPHLGPFCTFLGPLGLFWGWGQIPKLFWMAGWVAGLVENIATHLSPQLKLGFGLGQSLAINTRIKPIITLSKWWISNNKIIEVTSIVFTLLKYYLIFLDMDSLSPLGIHHEKGTKYLTHPVYVSI